MGIARRVNRNFRKEKRRGTMKSEVGLGLSNVYGF